MFKVNLKPTNTNLVLFAIGIILGVIGYPLALIWGLNTLFPIVNIPYSIETWAAAVLVRGFFIESFFIKGKD